MKQEEIVRKLMKKYQLNFSPTQEKVFLNHLETFYDRLIKNEDVGLELDDNLRSQVSDFIWKKANDLVNDYLVECQLSPSTKVSEAEVFLIATHLSLI